MMQRQLVDMMLASWKAAAQSSPAAPRSGEADASKSDPAATPLNQHDTSRIAVTSSPPLCWMVASGPSQADLDNWFSYHAPVGDQASRYEALRAAGKVFAERIIALTQPGPDQEAAIQFVRSAVHWANTAIACSPLPFAPATEEVSDVA